MERQMWHNQHPVGEDDSDEEESGEDDSDEEEDRQKFVRQENINMSDAGKTVHAQEDEGTSEDDDEDEEEEEEDGENDDDDDDDEEEELSEGKVGKSTPPAQGEKKQRISNAADSESGSDSDSESTSDDEAPKSIGKILASDRKASMDTSGKKVSFTLEKSLKAGVGQEESAVKKAKSEILKRPRDDAQEQEETPVKKKKEGGIKISPSAKGEKAHHDIPKETLHGQKLGTSERENSVQRFKADRDRPPSLEKEGSVGKRSRKQKGLLQDDTQIQVAERNGELDKKEQEPEKMDKVLLKKPEKTDRGQELEADRKSRKQKEQVPTLPQQAKEPLSPQKHKKPSVWTHNDETVLASGAMNRVKAGLDLQPKRSDFFFVKLAEELEGRWTKDQLYDKLRRMKSRYHVMEVRVKADDSKPFNFRNAHEESLYKIWKQTWGKGEVGKEEEEEEVQKVKAPAKSRVKPEASGIQRAKEGQKEPGTPRGKQGERIAEDAGGTDDEKGDEAHQGGAVLMELDQKRASNPGLTSLAMAIDSSLLSIPDSQDGKLFQRGSVDPSRNEVVESLRTLNKALLEELQTSCNRMLEEVQAKVTLSIQSALQTAVDNSRSHNGMNFALPSLLGSFGMPFLAGGDCLDMKLAGASDAAHDKLRHQWIEQYLQELKVYSQRLHLSQEQCRIQREHFEMQLSSSKG